MSNRIDNGLHIIVERPNSEPDFIAIPRAIYHHAEGFALLKRFIGPGDTLFYPTDRSLPTPERQQFARVVLTDFEIRTPPPGWMGSPRIHKTLPKYDHKLTPTEAWAELVRFGQHKDELEALLK